MNLGLTETLIESFPDITPKERAIKDENITFQAPYLFTGFTEAEGCFFVSVHKSKSYKVGYPTPLFFFSFVQQKREEKLIESFLVVQLSYFYSGKIQIGYNKTSICFVFTKKADLEKKLNPFFQKYSLNKEFIAFCSVLFLVNTKSLLTEQGLNQILEIKSGINSCR
jgi:LAGLIDADG DNA endonuclease family protein